MVHWRCISGCGACCRLDPGQRGEDLACLNDEQRRLYFSLVGEDGWCIHYDTGKRLCRVYDTRPDFCRVENLVPLFASPTGSAFPPPPMPEQQADASPGPSSNGVADPEAPSQRTPSPGTQAGATLLDPAGEALAIASCRTQIRAEYGGRGRGMKRFEQAIRRTP